MLSYVCMQITELLNRTIEQIEKLPSMQMKNTNGDDIFAYLSLYL